MGFNGKIKHIMIILDNNYRLENNSVHGVELVFEEKRENKKGELKTFIGKWYYPNPILAIKKWIELTSSNVSNLNELIKHTEEIHKTLDNIYVEFVNNKRKL